MLCILEHTTLPGFYRCTRCGWHNTRRSAHPPEKTFHECAVENPLPLGTWLKRLLSALRIDRSLRWVHLLKKCGCSQREARLNHWGERLARHFLRTCRLLRKAAALIFSSSS